MATSLTDAKPLTALVLRTRGVLDLAGRTTYSVGSNAEDPDLLYSVHLEKFFQGLSLGCRYLAVTSQSSYNL